MEEHIARCALGAPGGGRQVVLTRDSVAAGDDVDAPHEAIVTYHDGMPLVAALHGLALRYLPHVAGAPVGWRAVAAGTLLGWIIRGNAPDGATCTEVRHVAPGAVLAAAAIHFTYVAANAMAVHGPR